MGKRYLNLLRVFEIQLLTCGGFFDRFVVDMSALLDPDLEPGPISQNTGFPCSIMVLKPCLVGDDEEAQDLRWQVEGKYGV